VPQDVIGRILAEVDAVLADPSDDCRSTARSRALLAELAECVRWLEDERQDLGERLTQHLEPARARRAAEFLS
jgi:hypothetical protein